MVKMLVEAGFEAVEAPDYRRTSDILDDKKPLALLVMDIVIPGVNGFALMRMARMRQRELKVIYVSAFDVPTDEAIGPVRASACRSRRNSPSFPAVASQSTAVGAMPRGSGTVLVVEDNDLVLLRGRDDDRTRLSGAAGNNRPGSARRDRARWADQSPRRPDVKKSAGAAPTSKC